MDKEILKKYQKAGKINQEAKDLARKELKPGLKVLDLAEKIEKFIKEIRPGKTVGEMSKLVDDVVTSHGFNPVRNLAGHSVGQYMQHGGLSIPNGFIPSTEEIKEDQVLGMEVFTTDGEGSVKESSPTLIYMFSQPKPVRLNESRKILQLIFDEYKTLPFAR